MTSKQPYQRGSVHEPLSGKWVRMPNGKYELQPGPLRRFARWVRKVREARSAD